MTDTARLSVTVRPAAADDAPVIRAVAHAAWRATYSDLIGAGVVERFLAQAYTLERVALRIERHDVFVAAVPDGDPSGVDGFIESLVEDDHAHIAALYTWPTVRGRGLGTALLQRVIDQYPGLDISADVLEGNVLGEPFYVAKGFVPGDDLDEELGGATIRERRWWLRAGPDATGG